MQTLMTASNIQLRKNEGERHIWRVNIVTAHVADFKYWMCVVNPSNSMKKPISLPMLLMPSY